jgi:ABC-type branched-subunit amino acid transport system substrate-binding protein
MGCGLTALAIAICAACGSASGAGTSSSNTSGAGSSDSLTGGLTGSPILIGNISAEGTSYDNNNDRLATIRAAIRAINKSGGIKGHPLELIYCNGQHDPNAELSCANQLVSDHVVATIGSEVANPSVIGVLNNASIADIDTEAYVPEEFTNPDSYLLTGGASYQVAGVVSEAAALGYKKLFFIGATGEDLYVSIVKQVAAKKGIKVVGESLLAANTADFDPTAAQVGSSGADSVIIEEAPQQLISIVNAIEAQGLHPEFLTNGDIPHPSDLASMSNGAGNDFLIGADTPPPSATQFPAIKQFNAEIAAEYSSGDHDATISQMRMSAVRTWLDTHIFAEVAKTLTTVTAASVRHAYDTDTNINGLGLVPSWTPSTTGCYTGYPRVSNPYIWYLKVQNNQFVLAANQPVNMDPLLC